MSTVTTVKLSRASVAIYARNFIFGVEDSLVSTVGLLSGVASAAVDRRTVVVTGVVLIAVEALSMGVGSFLSEQTAEEYERRSRGGTRRAGLGAAVMFASYLLAGLIPLGPYLLAGSSAAFGISITITLVALASLGVVSALVLKLRIIKQVVRMVVLGGLATAVGILVGKLAS